MRTRRCIAAQKNISHIDSSGYSLASSGLFLGLLEFALAGPFAWFDGETGQVGNEAAIVV